MAVLFKGALLAGLLCSCVVAGSYLPRRGCIDIAAPWMERQPGQRWSPETGECSELACHPEGAVTVTSCHVGTPPPGCTLEAAKKGAVFPECCPRVRCLSDTRKARKDSWNSLTPSFLSLLSSLGVLTSYSAPLRHPPHRPADTAGRPITGAAPAQWPLNQVLSADHAGTTETVPKAEAPHRVADTGAPVMVAGRPITGKALRFYNKFLGRTPAASKSPVPWAWAATSRSLPLDGLLPFGEMFPLEEMLLSLDGMLPFEDDLLLGKLLLDGLPRDRDNELQVESPTMVVSTQQKETL